MNFYCFERAQTSKVVLIFFLFASSNVPTFCSAIILFVHDFPFFFPLLLHFSTSFFRMILNCVHASWIVVYSIGVALCISDTSKDLVHICCEIRVDKPTAITYCKVHFPLGLVTQNFEKWSLIKKNNFDDRLYHTRYDVVFQSSQ